jgi:pre-rRNA-processing protein TSR2
MDDKLWILFVRASERVFDNWTLVSLAVGQGWGGRDSAKKKARLLSDIQERLSDNLDLSVRNSDDVRDLQEELAYELVERFNCEVDDGSDGEVAEILLRLLTTLRDGDETYANTVLKSAKNDNGLLNSIGIDKRLHVDGSPADYSDEDNGENSTVVETAKPVPKHTATLVDDDGFTTVSKGKKNRKASQVPEGADRSAAAPEAKAQPAAAEKLQVANGCPDVAQVPVVAAAYPAVDGDGFIVVKKGKKNVKNDRADSAANDVAKASIAPGARWADVSDDEDDVITPPPQPTDEWQVVGKKGPKRK